MAERTEPVSITHYDGLDNTPAAAIALRGQLECTEAGGEQAIGLHYSYKAIVAAIFNKPVGVIVWIPQKEQHRIWLQLGYVAPEYRRMGIYSDLWKELIGKARELSIPEIWSGTASNNFRMREIARHQGRHEVAISLRFIVPAEELIHG